jgi:hypothetical protein
MSRTAGRLAGIALLLAACIALYAPARIAWIVGSCSVAGGSFDYHEGECDLKRTHKGEFLSVISPFTLGAGILLALGGGLLLVFSRRLASSTVTHQ